jgi:hypothetical protein
MRWLGIHNSTATKIVMRRLILGLTLAVAGLIPASRMGETARFDFEEIDLTADGDGNDYSSLFSQLESTQGGLTMTVTHRNISNFAINQRPTPTIPTPFAPAFGLQALSAFNGLGGASSPFRFVLDFSLPLSSATVDFGDFGGDDDALSLEAYSGPGGMGTLLASAEETLPGGGSDFSFITLEVQASAIRSLTLIGGYGAWPNSVFYDNIAVNAVPEPSTLSMLLAGTLTLLMYASFRQQEKSPGRPKQ